VRLLEAEDLRAELRAACAEIRSLLHAGVAPHRITLAVPRLAWHRTHIVAALDVAEIPWQESRPRMLLQQAAPLRLVGELLDAAERTLPREALAAILESAYVAKPGAAVLVRALREAGSRDDREPGHLARLRRHAARLAAHGSEREREQAAKLLALADDWQRTFERLRLRERASIAEHLDALFSVLRALGVPRRCLTMPSLGQGTRERRFERDAVLALARDRQALEALEIVGHGLVEAATKVGLDAHVLPLADFRAHLEAALANVPTPSTATSGSGVALRDLAEFAGSQGDYVFVLHAVEGELPGPGRALPFLDDDDRAALDAAAGRPVLPPHGAADALAFALACAGAREGLVVAAHHQDAEGRELLPSRWFSALAKLKGTPTRVPAEVVAPLASCSTKGQVLTRLGLRASSGEGQALLALALVRAPALAPTLAWIRARTHDGARARVRLAPHALALAHAVLDFDPTGTRASQPEQAGLTWSGSSTALEHYASCPFRLFASRVLRVRPLPSTRDELDALEQGKVRHEVLAEVMLALRSAGLTPLRGGDQAWQEDELALDVCARVLDEWAIRERTGPRALWILQRDLVVRDLLRVLEGERRSAIEAWQPELFECGFGLPSPRDPSVIEGTPLAIPSRDGQRRFELVGRVDRVDLRGDGREREGLVIDYKSGRVGERLRYDQLARTQLQLPLYAAWLAAARPELGHTDAAYVSLRDGERSKVSMLDLVLSSVELDGMLELDPERRAALRERARSEAKPGDAIGAPLVARGALELPASGQRNLADNVWALLGGIAEGQFDVRPFEPGRTCSLCPYAVVCRIERGDELAGPASLGEEPDA
jgi:RecB family exonuclease